MIRFPVLFLQVADAGFRLVEKNVQH